MPKYPDVTQAEDRTHRIGRVNPVLVHLVLDGSLDAKMADVLVKKRAVLNAARDQARWQPGGEKEGS